MPEPTGNPEDAQLVRDAREELGLSQRQIGKLIGMWQPGVSETEHQRRALTPMQRSALQRELVRCRALRELEACGGRRPPACGPSSPALVSRERVLDHVLSCRWCLARAAFQLIYPDP